MRKSNILFLFTVIAITVTVFLMAVPTNSKVQSKDLNIKSKIRTKDGMEMVYIPPGEFTMGSTFFESVVFKDMKLYLFPDQRPQHIVYLDKYWIDKTEVTVGMFKKFVKETGYITSAENWEEENPGKMVQKNMNGQ